MPLDAADVSRSLPADLALATVSAPGSCVVAGKEAAVRRFAAELEQRGTTPKFLNIPCASHSPLMRPAAEELARVMRGWTFHAPEIPFFSSVRARFVEASEVGNTAAFLSSSLASGITGTVVHVDKGYHAMACPVDVASIVGAERG